MYREGRRYSGHAVVLYVRATESGRRIGITAGRGLGGAVVRNRAKRRLREAFRRLERRLCASADIVLVARSDIATAEFTDVVREIEGLCAAGRLLCKDVT